MATGDQADMAARVASQMPRGWIPGASLLWNGLFQGFGALWSAIYNLIGYAAEQLRIATATDLWLDLISADLFGYMPRRLNETDASFRRRIQLEVLRPRNTRAAMVQALTDLTGRAPMIFEPSQPSNTGGYGVAMGYDSGGALGSQSLPFQFFITAYRGTYQGIPNVAGYGAPAGGYGRGRAAWASPTQIIGTVTDQDILDTINRTKPAGTIAWTQISN